MKKAMKNILKIMIIIIVITSIILLAQLAWSKYMTKVEGEASADIAHFSFTVTEKSSNSLTIDLADTRLPNDATSVEGTTVAPGTKGALAFDINANTSDVSLKYDIDIDITEVPQNLIFYSDLGMTNAIYHSNNNININGFFSKNTEDKTETKVIYWYWPLETGQTEEQIEINDGIDSTSMGDLITVDIQVTGQQVNVNSVENQYVVTLDANGGTFLDGYGNSDIITKNVTSTYGNLPIPKKEGYEFVGWSRNLADEISEESYIAYHFNQLTSSVIMNDGEFNNLTNQKYIRIYGNSSNNYVDTSWRIYSSRSFKVKEGETYKVCFYIRSQNARDNQVLLNKRSEDTGNPTWYFIKWNDETVTYFDKSAVFANDGNWHYIENTITVPEGVTGGYIYLGADTPNLNGAGSYLDIANIQFAKDSSVTPYYVDSGTISQGNTTLYAKWRSMTTE